MEGHWPTSCVLTLVFLMLMVRPKPLHNWEKQSISLCRASSVWVARAASSANSMSRTRISDSFVFALRHAMLNSLPSVRLCRYTSSDDDLTAWDRSEKNIPKSVKARTQLCPSYPHGSRLPMQAAEFGGSADLLQKMEEAFPADEIERFG